MWLNPVVLTRKKPGSPHFYLHPRHVNDLSGPDGFEPPVLNNVIRSLQWFSYLRLSILKTDIFRQTLPKSIVRKWRPWWELAGWCNSGRCLMVSRIHRHFSRGGMQFVPKGPIPCKCVVYIDYILVFGSNKEEHDRNFKGVMYRLKLYNLTVNQEKLIYDAENATFLGYSIAMNAMKLLRTGPMGIRNWMAHKRRNSYADF